MSQYNPSTAPARSKGPPLQPSAPPPPSAEVDAVIRSIDAAPDNGPRVRHVGQTEDGHVVTTRTHKPIHQVMATLQRKAMVQAILELPPEEVSTAFIECNDPEREPTPAERHLDAIEAMRDQTRPMYPVDLSPRPTVGEIARSAKGQIHAYWSPNNAHSGAHWQHPSQQSGHPMPWMGHVIQSDVRLSDRYPTYLKYLEQKKTTRPHKNGGLWTLRILTELVGDKRLCDVGPDDMDVFLQAISVWPPHASKRKDYRQMKAPQVVKKAVRLREEPIDLGTQQRHIDMLRTLFKWLESRHEVVPGLLKGVRLFSSSDDRGKHRRPFDTAVLRKLFDPKHMAKFRSPFQYWCRYLALYQGMRVNELSQLYVDDIVNIGGTWCIDVTRDRAGQRLKNYHSRRTLPIHPVLLENGFLEFVAQSRAWGRATLFPGLTWGTNGPGDAVSDWFNRSFLRKTCAVKDPGVTFHSFRHNFATTGVRSNLPDADVAQMLGHTSGDSVLRKHYVLKIDIAQMASAMAKMRFPKFDHVAYSPEQFNPAFQRAAAEEARQARLEEVYGRAA